MFNNEYKALSNRFDTLSKELSDTSRMLINANSEIEQYKNTIEDNAEINIKNEVLIEQYKIQIETIKNSVNAKVNYALSSIGVGCSFANESIDDNNNVKGKISSPQLALSKFLALVGNDKSEFYKENKDNIILALNNVKS